MSEDVFKVGSDHRRRPQAAVPDGSEARRCRRDDAAGHVDQLCCPSPWALAEPGIPVETADERRRQASHSSRRGSRSGFGSPQARGPRPRARTSSGSQDHGGRDPQGGSRPRTDKKTDLAVAIAKSRRFAVKTVAATLQVVLATSIWLPTSPPPRRPAAHLWLQALYRPTPTRRARRQDHQSLLPTRPWTSRWR